jgi:hypothetical protein
MDYFTSGLFAFLLFLGLYIVASSLDKIAEAQKATADAIQRIADGMEK